MKRCSKARTQPRCLEEVWNEMPNGTWEQLRDEQSSCYHCIRNRLREDQGGICAYCEISLSPDNEQVAHFHPKSDTSTSYNWALDWENLWLACKGGSQSWMQNSNYYCPPLPENLSCDEKKGNAILDGQVLKPGDIPAFPRIFRFEQFADSVMIRPDDAGCRSANVPIDKVEQTIIEFGLNCPRLARARLSSHRQIEQALKKLRLSGYVNQDHALALLVRRHLGRTPDGNWRSFFTLVRWRLGNAAESYLHAIEFDG